METTPVSTNNQTQSAPEIPPKNIPCCFPQSRFICILTASILVLLVGAGSFLLGKYYSQSKTSALPQISPTPTSVAIVTPTPDPTINWKTHSSNRLKYSFKYPQEWTFYPYKEDDPEFAFGAHTLSSYSGSEIEKYMDHGVVNWKKFLGDKPAIKIDFLVYSKETHQINDVRKYAQEALLKSAAKMPESNLKIDNLETIQYKATEDLGPTDVEEINQYFAFPSENKIVFISLYFWNVQGFEYLQDTAEWQTLANILSTFKFLD